MEFPDSRDAQRIQDRKIAIAAEIVRPIMPTHVVILRDRHSQTTTAITMAAKTA